MEIKFGKKKIEIEIPYENMLESLYSNNKINDTIFPEFDSEYLYSAVSQDMIKYFKEFNKLFKRNVNLDERNNDCIKDKAGIFPANGHDICNYLARYGIANFQIQTVMKLDGNIEFNKLSKAVRLSVDAEPVLGCRFVEDDPPYWRRLKNLDESRLCSFEQADNYDSAVRRFLETPLDMDNDPMVKVRLIRFNKNDTLCIKINHACSDARGLREYIQLLSKIYSLVDKNGSRILKIKPRIGGRKDQDKLFDGLGIKYPEIGWNPFLISQKTTWMLPLKKVNTNAAHVAVLRLPAVQLNAMNKYRKSKGATINDLILTAYYRAMFEISKPAYGIPMDITTTIDLRRYLPNGKAEAIRNFSGGFNTRISRVKNEAFDDTLSRVMHSVNDIKSGHPGLLNAMGGEYVEKIKFLPLLNYYKLLENASKNILQYPYIPNYRCNPSLSNLGLISKSLIKFGENTVTSAYMVPPAVRAPGMLLFVSTYNNVITLSISYYKASISRKTVRILLNKIKDELLKGCAGK